MRGGVGRGRAAALRAWGRLFSSSPCLLGLLSGSSVWHWPPPSSVFATGFLAVDFFAAGCLAAGSLAGNFSAGGLLAGGLRATGFLAGSSSGSRVLGAGFSATVFFGADFGPRLDMVTSAPRASRIGGRERTTERHMATLRQASGNSRMNGQPRKNGRGVQTTPGAPPRV